MKNEIEQFKNMKNAYVNFMIERNVPATVIVASSNDEIVIDNFVDMYFENEHNFQIDTHKTEIENMTDYLNYVDDVDSGGVSENFAIVADELGIEFE